MANGTFLRPGKEVQNDFYPYRDKNLLYGMEHCTIASVLAPTFTYPSYACQGMCGVI